MPHLFSTAQPKPLRSVGSKVRFPCEASPASECHAPVHSPEGFTRMIPPFESILPSPGPIHPKSDAKWVKFSKGLIIGAASGRSPGKEIV